MSARSIRTWTKLACLATALAAVTGVAGCARSGPTPVADSREALGTIVTITAYGDDHAEVQRAIDRAYDAIRAVEAQLSAYPDHAATFEDAGAPVSHVVTSVAEFNRDPFAWHLPPSAALRVLDRVDVLGVGDEFTPGMLRVVQLYDFEGGGRVPDDTELARLVRAARAFETRAATDGVEIRFAPTGALVAPTGPAWSSYAPPAVGLDLSGALKGLALDAALDSMRQTADRGEITGALISSGSTTLVAGSRPQSRDSRPWRVGIEDPRDPEKVVAVVDIDPARPEASNSVLPFATVSTSGDYQQSFVRNGTRYHHILDPVTGRPARGIRSLTVVGATNGLDSDVLSTALFVMGADRAEAYAREHGLGLFIIDASGRTRIVPGPKGAAWDIREGSE